MSAVEGSKVVGGNGENILSVQYMELVVAGVDWCVWRDDGLEDVVREVHAIVEGNGSSEVGFCCLGFVPSSESASSGIVAEFGMGLEGFFGEWCVQGKLEAGHGGFVGVEEGRGRCDSGDPSEDHVLFASSDSTSSTHVELERDVGGGVGEGEGVMLVGGEVVKVVRSFGH